MPEYKVDICYNWDGRERVCDLDRCKSILDGNDMVCYHKPITVDGKRLTVVGALDRILGEPNERVNQEGITVNGQQCTQLEAIRKIFEIEQNK